MLTISTNVGNFTLIGHDLSDDIYKNVVTARQHIEDTLIKNPFVYIVPLVPALRPTNTLLINRAMSFVATATLVASQSIDFADYREFLYNTYINSAISGYTDLVNLIKETVEISIDDLSVLLQYSGNDNMENVLYIPEVFKTKALNRIDLLSKSKHVVVPSDISVNISVLNELREDIVEDILKYIRSLVDQVALGVTAAASIIELLKNLAENIPGISKLKEAFTRAAQQSFGSESIDGLDSKLIKLVIEILSGLYSIVYARLPMMPYIFTDTKYNTKVKLEIDLSSPTPMHFIDNIFVPLCYFYALATPRKLKDVKQNENIEGDDGYTKFIKNFLNDIDNIISKLPIAAQPYYVSVIVPGSVIIPFGIITSIDFEIKDQDFTYGGLPKRVQLSITIDDISGGFVFANKGTNNNLNKIPPFFGLLIRDILKEEVLRSLRSGLINNVDPNMSYPKYVKVDGNVALGFTTMPSLKKISINRELNIKDPVMEKIVAESKGVWTIAKGSKFKCSVTDNNLTVFDLKCKVDGTGNCDQQMKYRNYKLQPAPVNKQENDLLKDMRTARSINEMISILRNNSSIYYSQYSRYSSKKSVNNIDSLEALRMQNTLRSSSNEVFMASIYDIGVPGWERLDDQCLAKLIGLHLVTISDESNGNPFAQNIGNDTGLGQFIEGTAKKVFPKVYGNLFKQSTPLVSDIEDNRCKAMEPITNAAASIRHLLDGGRICSGDNGVYNAIAGYLGKNQTGKIENRFSKYKSFMSQYETELIDFARRMKAAKNNNQPIINQIHDGVKNNLQSIHKENLKL